MGGGRRTGWATIWAIDVFTAPRVFRTAESFITGLSSRGTIQLSLRESVATIVGVTLLQLLCRLEFYGRNEKVRKGSNREK
jgi:hypothetical protein